MAVSVLSFTTFGFLHNGFGQLLLRISTQRDALLSLAPNLNLSDPEKYLFIALAYPRS